MNYWYICNVIFFQKDKKYDKLNDFLAAELWFRFENIIGLISVSLQYIKNTIACKLTHLVCNYNIIDRNTLNDHKKQSKYVEIKIVKF